MYSAQGQGGRPAPPAPHPPGTPPSPQPVPVHFMQLGSLYSPTPSPFSLSQEIVVKTVAPVVPAALAC